MRKIICGITAVILLSAVGVRIWYVNRDIVYSEEITYAMGEEAFIGKNIFYDDIENYEGYSVTVNRAELLTYEEYLDKYDYVEDEEFPVYEDNGYWFPHMIIDVDVTVRNTNSEETPGGIDFLYYSLWADDFEVQHDLLLFDIANPDLPQEQMYQFAVRPGTEMDFHFPFSFDPETENRPVTMKDIENNDLYLWLSYYPQKVQILIETE